MARDGYVDSPRRVTDIDITRVYEVVCDDHGVIDAPRRYADAIAVRREHWFSVHKEVDHAE